MQTIETTTRYNSLNAKQIHILKLAYKFRFVTAPLLAQYKNLKSRHAMYITLERLAKQGYLLRCKDETPFNNKGIRYGLTPKAFKVLKAEGISAEKLKPLYRNKDVLEDFISHEVAVMRAYIAINKAHPGIFEIYSKTELQPYEQFPRPRQDLYLQRTKSLKTKPDTYFVELFHDQPLFIAKKRLRQHLDHYDSEWPDETYPTLVFVLANERAEKSFKKYAQELLEDRGMDDEVFVITSSIEDNYAKVIC